MNYISSNTKRPHGDRYYVTPYNNLWAVRCEKNHLVAYVYNKKEEALFTGKLLAKEFHAELVIEKSDGSVQETISYN